jgi:putative phosphoribosyl transferase
MTNDRQLDDRQVDIQIERTTLVGDLSLPPEPKGLVLFAHGSGSSRLSPRNRTVSRALNGGGVATLLLDLLSREEGERDEVTARFRFNIPLLAERLAGVSDWVRAQPGLRNFPLGYFGASTGAAAALVAAATRPGTVSAIVSRGGRPDLAGHFLAAVRAPTLLIVGSRDPEVLAMNRVALRALGMGAHQLTIVRGATHLFEEEGALEEVSRLALSWFQLHLAPQSANAPT